MALVRNNLGPLNIFFRDGALVRAEAPDVVLLQGFGTGPRCMRTMADHLERYGHNCAVAPTGGLFGHLQTRGVARAGKRLVRYLDQLDHGVKPWLIGHSIGGIMARWAVQRGGAADKIAGVVTIGTPHMGCPIAYAGLFLGLGLVSPAPWAILPISPTIRRLNKAPWPAGLPLISIMSNKDILCRPKSSRVPFADHDLIRNVVVDTLGHTEMLRSPRLLDVVRGFIEVPHAA